MENASQVIGRLLGALLFAVPALYVLVRGVLPAGPRARRLANLALFLGLLVFVLPELALGGREALPPTVSFASGGVRLVCGIAAVIVAVVALRSRRGDEVGRARPLVAAGFGVLEVLLGIGFLVFGFIGSPPSDAWVYQAPDDSFRLTLPSSRWKEAPARGGGVVVAFVCPVPHMQAAVQSVKRNQARDDFRRAADSFRAYVGRLPPREPPARFQEGTNAAGCPYSYCTVMDADAKGKPVYVAHVLSWSPEKAVLVEVLFEGVLSMAPEVGQATEAQAFDRAAEGICLSVQ